MGPLSGNGTDLRGVSNGIPAPRRWLKGHCIANRISTRGRVRNIRSSDAEDSMGPVGHFSAVGKQKRPLSVVNRHTEWL